MEEDIKQLTKVLDGHIKPQDARPNVQLYIKMQAYYIASRLKDAPEQQRNNILSRCMMYSNTVYQGVKHFLK